MTLNLQIKLRLELGRYDFAVPKNRADEACLNSRRACLSWQSAAACWPETWVGRRWFLIRNVVKCYRNP